MDSRFIGGKYKITGEIAEGGAAQIFLAINKYNDNDVVLKVPLNGDPGLINSLKGEYRFACTHCHPSLLKPHDLLYESHTPILVYPYLRGPILDKYIDALRNGTDSNRFIPALKRVMAEILEAAGFIHFSGYCYNDFKPSNIIACDTEEIRAAPRMTLIDFNLVTRIGDRPGRRGTLHYLAPEVLCGDSPTPGSDIYSLGVLFYQLLTGNLPYESISEPALIAEIINTGYRDLSSIPCEFRYALKAMLAREPEKRPSDTLQTAESLGIEKHYADLRDSRVDCYLSSGPPPFSRELKDRFDQFRKSGIRRLFFINGYSYSPGPMNFIEASLKIEGDSVFRITRNESNRNTGGIFDEITSTVKPEGRERIVIIDDLEILNRENQKLLNEIVNNRDDIKVIASGGRWIKPEIKREFFDPPRIWSCKRSSEECLKAFLSADQLSFEDDSPGDLTGGDPEQVYNSLKYACRRLGCDIISSKTATETIFSSDTVIGNRSIYRRMFDSLSPQQQELASILSAWGTTIPLLMFVGFDRSKRDIAESLINDGFLVRHRDSVSFISHGVREYVYGGIPDSVKNDFHKFWALGSEELIGDNEEQLEISAYHWGLTEDREKSYKYNLTAAREFLNSGKILKARKFSKTLLKMNLSNHAELIPALKIDGDICGAMGHFNSARKRYLEILSLRPGTSAQIKMKLARIYLASGNYRRSLYYIDRAGDYYKNAGDCRKLSICNDILTQVFFENKDYAKALERMIKDACKLNGFKLTQHQMRENESGSEFEDYPILKSILDVARHCKNHSMTIKAHLGLGQLYMNGGRQDEALEQIKKALDIAEKTGRKNDIIRSLIEFGSCHHRRGDLFMAIECFQNARQVAETTGNFYYKTLAELKLIDVSLAMGHYALARDVLRILEDQEIYNEDKSLRLMTDLRKARLDLALGDKKTSRRLAKSILKSASVRNKSRLTIRADLILTETQLDSNDSDSLDRLVEIQDSADRFGFRDLVCEAKLLLGEYHLNSGDRHNALPCFDDIMESAGATREAKLAAALRRLEIAASQNGRADIVDLLIETESHAAASGFIPMALKTSEVLGELYYSKGRADLAEDCHNRTDSYFEKITSALPDGCSPEHIKRRLKLKSGPFSAAAKKAGARKTAPIAII